MAIPKKCIVYAMTDFGGYNGVLASRFGNSKLYDRAEGWFTSRRCNLTIRRVCSGSSSDGPFRRLRLCLKVARVCLLRRVRRPPFKYVDPVAQSSGRPRASSEHLRHQVLRLDQYCQAQREGNTSKSAASDLVRPIWIMPPCFSRICKTRRCRRDTSFGQSDCSSLML